MPPSISITKLSTFSPARSAEEPVQTFTILTEFISGLKKPETDTLALNPNHSSSVLQKLNISNSVKIRGSFLASFYA